MKVSERVVEAAKGFEGFRAEAYRCPAGKWTIGYGHTLKVWPGQRIDEQAAAALLRWELEETGEAVADAMAGVTLSQGQFDALVDFAYNLGINALKASTLRKRLLAGEPAEAVAEEFGRWVHCGGKVLPGLVARRAEEKEWFLERSEQGEGTVEEGGVV